MAVSKHNILLIHGALGSSKIFDDLKQHFSKDINVYCLDLFGHGIYSETKDVTISMLCSQIKDFIELNKLQGVSVFGYSMGGYLSIMVGLQRSGIFSQIITLGTKFNWSESIAIKEVQQVQSILHLPNEHPFKKQQFALHGESYFNNCIKITCNLITEIGKNKYITNEKLFHFKIPTLLLIGDQDTMVTGHETEEICKAMPNAKLMTLPETKHPFEKVNKLTLAKLIESKLL